MQTSLKALILIPIQAVVFLLSWLVPRDDQLWVFMAGDGDRFADNSKYLYLYCQGLDSIRNVWVGTNPEIAAKLQDAGYEAYTTNSFRGKYMLLRAGVQFETHGPIAPAYSGRAKLIHLTHGNYLKTMLDDHSREWPWIVRIAVELLFERRRRYVVTGSGPPAANMQSMRGAPSDRLLTTGFPRNDALFREMAGERLYLNEAALDNFTATAQEKTVLLYAPTHREAYGEQNGIPLSDIEFGFQRLDDILAANSGHLYISPHPASSFDQDLSDCDNIELLNTGGDLYPFFRECDVLVTDYSGVFYDFLLLDRPVLFYAPDLSAYLNDRELYFEYETHVPGVIATDPSEFADSIENILREDDCYSEKRQIVRSQFYDDPDGNACERLYKTVADTIFDENSPDRY